MRIADHPAHAGAHQHDPRGRDADAGRPKKLLIALAVSFGNWDGKNGGSIYCECFFRDPGECLRCGGLSFIELPGPPERWIQGNQDDCFRSVMLVIQSVLTNFPRCPTELLEQPAKWIAALDFLTPYASREIEQQRDDKLKGK